MLVPALVEVVAGLVVLWVSVRMRQGRVRRDRAVGVRTRATMRSDEAFEVANRAAAPLTGAGSIVLAAGGVLAAVAPRHLVGAFLFGAAGGCLALSLLGAGKGVRACRTVR